MSTTMNAMKFWTFFWELSKNWLPGKISHSYRLINRWFYQTSKNPILICGYLILKQNTPVPNNPKKAFIKESWINIFVFITIPVWEKQSFSIFFQKNDDNKFFFLDPTQGTCRWFSSRLLLNLPIEKYALARPLTKKKKENRIRTWDRYGCEVSKRSKRSKSKGGSRIEKIFLYV